MRIRGFTHSTLLLLALVSTAPLRAQFQQPTDEELKMTADPKAPGAAAVYLYREETTDDVLHYHSYYERIKVLTEKGKEQATIRIPYEHGQFKITDIKGRTIHADGTVIPLTVKPTDLVDVKGGGFQVNTMVFTLPSVEIGSILEYRLDLRYDDSMVSEPTWHIQQPLFVHKAHYMFKPESGGGHYITDQSGHLLNWLMFATTGVPADKVAADNVGRYTVDLTDIPPTPNEDWMPPLNTINERVNFYYTYAHSGKDFWDSEMKHWAKEVERFTKPSSQVKSAAAEIVGSATGEEQKARLIYTAVMKLDNTDFSRKKSEAELKAERLKAIRNAEDVWAQKSGSSDDMALLYVALARAAGLKVWPMQVVDRSRAIFDARYLNIGQLDDYIAVIEIGGKEIYLDPGQKMCPFGLLHWKHALATGARLSDKGPVEAATPAIPYSSSVEKRVALLDIDPTGAVKGTVSVLMNGPQALHWRQMALENDVDEVKKRFNESIQQDLPDGVQAEFDHFVSLDDYNADLMGVVKVSGNIGTATGKHVFLPGFFFESRARHPFVAQDKRSTPIDVQYARLTVDDVTYHLPPGFTVESAPQAAGASWPDHAVLKAASTTTAAGVEVTRTLAYNFALLNPADYPGLHDFYQKVATADQQQLVLNRAQIAKGD
jgi:hypothetical protein